jgi:hypothetical protein
MTLTSSPDTRARFTLDPSSFEKFLAAAWVLQCRRDQELLSLKSRLSETRGQPVGAQKELAPGWRSAVKEVAPANVTASEDAGPVCVELQCADLSFDGRLKDPHPLVVVDREFGVHDKLGDNRRASQINWHAYLRSAFNNFYRAFNDYQHTFHITFRRHAIRSVAFTIPIFVLAVLSAGLLLEMRHHQLASAGQAISQSGVASEEAVTADPSKSLKGATQSASQQLGTTATSASLLVSPLATLQPSHLQVTDAPTASLVRELSRYEIRGLRRRARYGDTSAAFELGMAYETGRHLRQSCVEAAHWVARAAEAGNAAAEYNLGLRYRTGDGVRTNLVQSQRWLRKAARRNPNAKLALKLLASR